MIELSEFDIQYQPRTAIMAQALANFVAQFTAKEDEDSRLATWMIWINGLSNQQAKGAGILLQSPEGDTIECAIYFQFPTTNNEAEYEAVLSSLNLAKAARTRSVVIHCDLQVVIKHINGDYEAKGEQMKEYLSMIKGKINKGLSVKGRE